MDKNKLQHGEHFVGQYYLGWDAGFGDGGSHSGYITLTDRRLILEWKNYRMFKATAELSTSYNLNEATGIRVLRADRKSDDGKCECAITFLSGSIEFDTGSRQEQFEEFRRFVNDVNHEITGTEEDIVGNQKTIFSGFANTLGAATKEFGQAFGISSAAPAAKASPKVTRVSVVCKGCGAPLSGIKGKTVTCDYCCVTRQL